ncbi:MAG: trehalose-6-phosphate synthase [Oligoflexia bacterium]|nr:trehalose-6-phosphate synthase [Oligoflexia bacterium]
MKIFLRFLLPLILIICALAYAVVPLVDSLTIKWFARDIEARSKLIFSTIQEPLAELITAQENKGKNKIERLFSKATQDERLYAMALCDKNNTLFVKNSTFPDDITCPTSNSYNMMKELPSGPIYIASYVLYHPTDSNLKIGELILLHDLSFIERRSALTKEYIIYFLVSLGMIIALLTIIVAKISFLGWMKGIRALVNGELLWNKSAKATSPEFDPILRDLRHFVREVEKERRFRDEVRISWNPKALKGILQKELLDEEVIIVSNREPYLHVKKENKIEIQFPASGVVTALEPIMRACSGTWIAHGSGSADREVVDKNDRIVVPPDAPSYTLRRVWLSKEEEDGYYLGFANEGLWPLCHIAHVRPIFRSSDWQVYQKVNKKFAEAVAKEAKTKNPVILVQDYHFALLPKLINELLPKATIITFWHIPWPNPESFGICPWKDEILEGLLGSTIIGFHTQFHCNNFIETVDRYLECRIDRANSSISFKGKLSAVNNYPISIEYPVRWSKNAKSIETCRSDVLIKHNIRAETLIGVGVDRMDYTKGILERFRSVERLFEAFPEWIGKFVFIQIAAPSRSSIDNYQRFSNEVEVLASKINHKFSSGNYVPIVLIAEHRDPAAVFEYYRASNFCFVSSLHDGMNLVAKEYLAAKDDELGMLILSQFAGAAQELPEAIIVNPYDIDQCAQAINSALSMSVTEQKERMQSMRSYIQEFNVYRWAGRMLMDAARLRRRNKILGKISL